MFNPLDFRSFQWYFYDLIASQKIKPAGFCLEEDAQ